MSRTQINSSLIPALNNNLSYRRPVMLWIDGNTIDSENNTGIANQTTIIFPDGDTRSVIENTGVTTKYRRFIITNTANFTSGTESGGLRSGLSRTANTWYALYAIKSQINTANFVLVGDTTFPTQANFATLNSTYGTNSWVYLGPIANGDNSASTNTILSFDHIGNKIHFTNGLVVNSVSLPGILLASAGAGNFFLAVTPGFGTNIGGSQVPPTVFEGTLTLGLNAGSNVGYDLTIGTGSRIPVTGTTGGSTNLALPANTTFRSIDSSASSLQWHNGTTGYAKHIVLAEIFDLCLSGQFGQIAG